MANELTRKIEKNVWKSAERCCVRMSERQVKLELMDKIEQIAKEIAKGNDVYITKSASGVVVKAMNVKKV